MARSGALQSRWKEIWLPTFIGSRELLASITRWSLLAKGILSPTGDSSPSGAISCLPIATVPMKRMFGQRSAEQIVAGSLFGVLPSRMSASSQMPTRSHALEISGDPRNAFATPVTEVPFARSRVSNARALCANFSRSISRRGAGC